MACTVAACGRGATIREEGDAQGSQTVRIALLHLAPRSGDLDANAALIRAAVVEVANRGADWCITPELALSGYRFRREIGLHWIGPLSSSRVAALSRLARSNGVTLFVGMPTRDGSSGRLHNSVVVIGRSGEVVGAYHKRIVIPGFVEGWARPGQQVGVFAVDGVEAGVLVCADAWPRRLARHTAAAGAEILVSSACWAPGKMGPNGVWERDSRLTGLPLLVCNTTGRVKGGDNRRSASVVDCDGMRRFTFRSPTSAVFLVDWDRQAGTFASAGRFSPQVSR
jgi:predicted amidohydrolase